MEYNKRKRDNQTQLTLKEFFVKHKVSIVKIVIFNFMMLIFGFLGEIGYLPLYFSVSIGFIFFGLTFYEIYSKFNYNISENKQLFLFFIIVWSLYGVAAVLPVLHKNIGYNFLDIVSKNFYGLFIFYKIMSISKHTS